MSEIAKRMRHRRFQIKPTSDVRLLIESMTGAKLQLSLDNVSLTGLGAWSIDPLPADEALVVGSILPAAKLAFDGQEYTLGRVVLRAAEDRGGRAWVAVSTIDAKPPVDGPLSKHFNEELDENRSPYGFELSPERFSLANFAEGQTPPASDIFAKAQQFNAFMIDWAKTAKFSYMNSRRPSMGHRIRLTRTRKGGREDYLIMGSNDYLGLAAHPEVIAAAKKAIDDYGFGSTGSPLTTGVTEIHVELADCIARMLGKEKAILFNSGYAANIGIINGLVQAQDLAVADMISHASIQDALQMCRGTSRYFKHNNVEHLERILDEHRDAHAGCLVVTEGVFSMDGDEAPLDAIVRAAKVRKARIMVDEAHSFGVLGARGLGACEKHGVLNQVDVIMGTFSKICGGIGGFVATTEEVANWLYFWARSHMFSVSIPPSTAAAALKALQLFQEDKTLIEQLRKNIAHFKRGLAALGYVLPASHESAVIPVIVGDEKKLESMNATMMEAGVFVIPIVYPAVGKTNSRFRFTVMATHTVSDLDYALNVLELAMSKANFKFEPGMVPGRGTKAA